MRIRMREDYGPRLGGRWVRVHCGQELDVPGDVPANVAEDWVAQGLADVVELDGVRRNPALPFQPGDVRVGELAERLAGVDDPDTLHALQRVDTRTTAAAYYERRLNELTAPPPDTETETEATST